MVRSIEQNVIKSNIDKYILLRIGVVLGSFVLAGINYFTLDLDDYPYTNPTVPISFISIALFIMITLGTLIGLIPAQRAVSIKPIEALREE